MNDIVADYWERTKEEAVEHGYEYRYLIVGERGRAEDMENQAILDYDYTN